MRIVLISPLGFPVNSETKYAGIEKLVYEYARSLSNSHEVTVLGHSQSIFPDKVTLLGTDSAGIQDIYIEAEIKQYQTYQSILRNFDIIHDFSHQHFASRFNPNLSSLNLFWHAPNEIQYLKAPYNIIGLSRWACRQFKQYYHQEARYQQSIGLDIETYKIDSQKKRTDRFLCLGIMDTQKGNLEVAKLCNEANVPLDIAGQPFNKDYVQEVLKYVDGKQIRYLGEVSESDKVSLMQTCKALVYYSDRPEVTSHKVQESMLCGAPVITARIGALPEIITDGINGILCKSSDDYLQAFKNVDSLIPSKVYNSLIETYNIRNVTKNYEPLYLEVAKGLRW